MQATLPKVLALLFVLAPALGLSGCPKPVAGGAPGAPSISIDGAAKSAAAGEVLAKIGEDVITVAELEARINKQSPFVRARFKEPERMKEYLDNQVKFEVLAKEAFRRGMQNDPEVLESLKKIVVQKLTRQEFDGRVSLDDITEEEMRRSYDEHRADYNKPEMMRAAHVFIAFGDDKAKAKARAEEVFKLAKDPAKVDDRSFFKELVEKHSEDEATKRTGGDLRYLTKEEVQERYGPAVAEELFAKEEVGEVFLVEGKDGFHVMKRTGRRRPIERRFEQVKSQIRNVLYREKRTQAFEQFIEDLKKELGVEVYEDKLSKVRVDAPEAASPVGLLRAGDDEGESGHVH